MRSIWSINDIQKKDKREPLPEHISAAVIGGGMAGILCAWFLMESGVDTVVLEAGTVGSGQTEGTTAKITSQHGLIYSRLTETMGQKLRPGMPRPARQPSISMSGSWILRGSSAVLKGCPPICIQNAGMG